MTPVADARTAGKLAAKVASGGPAAGSFLVDDLASDLIEITAEVEPVISQETGFIASGSRPLVLSRGEWAERNVDVMLDLLTPVLGKLDRRLASNPFAPIVRMAYPSMVGAQLGAVLGLISHRVLGQYDVMGGEPEEVWFVGVNLIEMERRFGFIPRDFRTWVTIHELTHRAQFEHHPWLSGFFREQVQGLLGSMNVDLKGVIERLKKPGDDPLPVRVLPPEQRDRFDRLQGFMSLIEGHGTFVMDHLGARLMPTHERIRRTFDAPARITNPLARLVYRLLGMELKKKQYEEGQKFVSWVYEFGGAEAVATAFASEATIPTAAEIRDPEAWQRRVLG